VRSEVHDGLGERCFVACWVWRFDSAKKSQRNVAKVGIAAHAEVSCNTNVTGSIVCRLLMFHLDALLNRH